MGKLGTFLLASRIFAPVIFYPISKTKYPNAQETQTNPKSPHNHGFEQFREIPIFSAHIWAWRHAGAWGSGTLKTPKKVDPPKSKLPKHIG